MNIVFAHTAWKQYVEWQREKKITEKEKSLTYCGRRFFFITDSRLPEIRIVSGNVLL